jgi:hypothetical protein
MNAHLSAPLLLGLGFLASPLAGQGVTTPAVSGISARVTAQGAGSVSWTAFSGATSYFVVRWNAVDAACCVGISLPNLPGTASSWQDNSLPKSGTYVYRVYATTPTGTYAGETRVVYTAGVAASSDPSLRQNVTAAGASGPGTALTSLGPTSQTVSRPTNPGPGPAPTDLQISGGPVVASLSWTAVTGATGYQIRRATAGSSTSILLTPNPITVPGYPADPLPDPRVSYTYQVIAFQADGRSGTATGSYTPPAPVDPTGFQAVQTAEGEVALTWKDAPGVTQYLLSGPGTTSGLVVPSNAGPSGQSTYRLKGVPNGSQSWTIASSYQPGGILTASQSWPKASLTVGSFSGRYRVTMIGFDVNTQTVDDPFGDGLGDEVYLASDVSTYSLSTNTWGARGVVRSLVFGDANNQPGRVIAGTLSPKGGLKSGDAYPLSGGGTLPPSTPKPNTFPMLLWEGQLTNDVDLLLLAPSLWESDGSDANFADWAKWVEKKPDPASMYQLKVELAATAITPVQDFDASYVGLISGPGVDHPIGITYMKPAITTTYVQYYVALTRRKIEERLASTSTIGGLGPGVLAVPVRDSETGVGFGGAYTIYLRIERLP